MLHPLLYISPHLSPIRPYTTAVFARLLRADLNYGHPAPQWFVIPKQYATKSVESKEPKKDAADKQSPAEKQRSLEQDPRIVFGEEEFRSIREKYRMPKYVTPLGLEGSDLDSCSVSWSPWIRYSK